MLGFQGTRLISALIVAHTALLLPQPSAAYQLEGPSGFTRKQAIKAQRFMIAAANPHAVRAVYEILNKGARARRNQRSRCRTLSIGAAGSNSNAIQMPFNTNKLWKIKGIGFACATLPVGCMALKSRLMVYGVAPTHAAKALSWEIEKN